MEFSIADALSIFMAMKVIGDAKKSPKGLAKAMKRYWSEKNIFLTIVKHDLKNRDKKISKEMKAMINNFYLPLNNIKNFNFLKAQYPCPKKK